MTNFDCFLMLICNMILSYFDLKMIDLDLNSTVKDLIEISIEKLQLIDGIQKLNTDVDAYKLY